jgi:hypothetical protein
MRPVPTPVGSTKDGLRWDNARWRMVGVPAANGDAPKAARLRDSVLEGDRQIWVVGTAIPILL